MFKFSLLILIALVMGSASLSGQLNYKEGFIVLPGNDTINGLINDGGELMNTSYCLFKPGRKEPAVRYGADQLISYSISGFKEYVSMELFINDEFKKVFTEVLLRGDIKLYYVRNSRETSFLLEKEGEVTGLIAKRVPIPISSESLYGMNNRQMVIPVTSEKFSNQLKTSIHVELYKEDLKSLFSDSESVQGKIDSMNYTRHSMVDVTKTYIEEKCLNDGCIRFERDLKMYKPSWGIYSGMTASRFIFLESDAVSGVMASAPVGIFANFPLPLFSDRLTLQVEMTGGTTDYLEQFKGLSDTLNLVGIQSVSLGIPVLLRYDFKSQKKIVPGIGAGKETGFFLSSEASLNKVDDLMLHGARKGGWFLEAGLDYKFSKSFSLFTTIRIQKSNQLIIEEQYSNHLSYTLVEDYEHFSKRYRSETIMLLIGLKF